MVFRANESGLIELHCRKTVWKIKRPVDQSSRIMGVEVIEVARYLRGSPWEGRNKSANSTRQQTQLGTKGKLSDYGTKSSFASIKSRWRIAVLR